MKKIYFTLILFSTVNYNAQTIRYVKSGATGNGTSWSNASGNIQTMINQSNSGDKVYVAEGTYIPTEKASNDVFQWLTNTPRGTTDDKAKTFVLKDGVAVYGGFSATSPVTDLSLRNFDLNPTQITTDVLGNDAGFSATNTYTDNYYHAVIAAGLTTPTIFDGFTIKGGTIGDGNDYDYIWVNGKQVQQGFGGALMIVDANTIINNIKINNTSRPIYSISSTANIKNLNYTENFGAAEIRNSIITFENMNYSDNKGHLYLSSLDNLANSNIKIKNATFARNQSGPSAIRITRTATVNTNVELDQVRFTGNISSSYGTIQNDAANLKISNSVATGNTSTNQTGFLIILTYGPAFITNVDIINSTIISNYNNFDWGDNTGAISGGSATNAHVKIRNSIVWGNKMGANYKNIFGLNNPNFTVANSIIQDAFDANGTWNPNYGVNQGGNSAVMPNFTQFVPMNTTAFSNGDFSLVAGSPGINEGDNNAYNTLVGPTFNKDVVGNTRVMGNSIDIGAYEFLEALSVQEIGNKQNIKVYPNPSSDFVRVNGLKEISTYQIINSIGQILMEGKIEPSNNEISLSKLPTGIYFIKLETKEETIVRKLIKK